MSSGRDMREYFGVGTGGMSTVPGDANLLGFIIQSDNILDRRRKINHIPFQYIEKVPNWTKEVSYEETQIPGRFENIFSYNSSTNNSIDLQIIYYAEADDPYDPILNEVDNRGNTRALGRDFNNILREQATNFRNEIVSGRITNPQEIRDRFEQARQQTERLMKARFNQFTQKKFGIGKPAFVTHWTIQKIQTYVKRLQSLVFPAYDNAYSPPKSVLLNIGETFWDVPVIVKNISIEHNPPFKIENLTSRFFIINLTLSTSYPMYQAISSSSVYNAKTGEVFARRQFNLRDLGV